MKRVHKSEARGRSNINWLNSYHTFSFAEYFDPDMVHFGPLRVMNDDYISGGGGFPMHPHKDMEILTIVYEGAVAHRDSMGHEEVIGVNQVQKMSAGSGIFHSEFNNSATELLHLYQIWILPRTKGLTPSYETRTIDPEMRKNKLFKVASGTYAEDSIFLVQDTDIYLSRLDASTPLDYQMRKGRGTLLQVVEGSVSSGEELLVKGDALFVTDEKELTILAESPAELILFDVPLNGF